MGWRSSHGSEREPSLSPRQELPQVTAEDALSKENQRIAGIYAAGQSMPEDIVITKLQEQFPTDPGRVLEVLGKYRKIMAQRETAIDK